MKAVRSPITVMYDLNCSSYPQRQKFSRPNFPTQPICCAGRNLRSPHTPSTTHLTAWFCQDPLFFLGGLRFYFGFIPVCVCPLVHPLCSSVPQTVTTTQYHSVWTSNGSPSSRATRLLRCFTQVSDMVFTTRHNRHNRQHNTTRA
jgi:hypothetical protein